MSDFIRRRELDFQLFELFDLEATLRAPHFEHLDRDAIGTVLDTAIKVAEKHFASNADWIDRNEPELVDGEIQIADVVKESIKAFSDAGFIAGGFSPDDGGMGLPQAVVYAYTAIFNAANVATAGYGLLTVAAANLLQAHGSADLVGAHLDDMLAGRTLGTMCLSEPGAGSSLGDLITTASLADDGTYRLTGNKMWISGAGHDLTDNILHLVLARIDGAPAGTRGISLFAVPRWLDDEDGRRRNDVHVAGLNHKMGYRGITNCALNFGENGGAVGWLVGEPNRGLKYMFQMMNEARIEVGQAAVMSAHAAYLYSLEYAQERRQGRHPGDRNPQSEPVAIIEHADVRRMLLQQRAYIEGGWAVCSMCAALVDDAHGADTAEARAEAQLLLDFLTPIAKAWPSNWCLKANELAIQVLGGYGYSREYPLERHYRDNRLNAIHEGTNGIQALDLLGRKVLMDGGEAFRLLISTIRRCTETHEDNDQLSEYTAELADAVDRVAEVTIKLGATAMEGELQLCLANASTYLDMLGHVVVGWQWLRMAAAAVAAEPNDYYRGKLVACRFFFRWELPKVFRWADLLESLEDTPLNTSAELF